MVTDMVNHSKLAWWQIVWMLLLIFFAFFYGIGSYAIADMNEGLYAEVAREMLLTKDFIIPHLNFVPYLEKPPLLYWLLAASFKVFGVTAFAARLIPALSSALTALAMFWFMQRLRDIQAGWLAVLVLCASFGYVLIGHVLLFDSLLTLWLTLTLMCVFLWHEFEKGSYLIAAYAFLGLAVLTKGLLPLVVAGGVVMGFIVAARLPFRQWRQIFHPLGMLLFLLIVLPWHLAAMFQLENFSWDYLINEQVLRFFNQRIPHDYHTGPIYFYLPRLLIYLFPLSLMLPSLLKTKYVRPPEERTLGHATVVHKDSSLILWPWFLFTLVLLSLSAAKGDYYMIIGFPPLVLLLAQRIKTYLSDNNYQGLAIYYTITAVVLLASAGALLFLLPRSTISNMHYGWLLPALLGYAGIGGYLIYRYRTPILAFMFLTGFIMPASIFYTNFEKAQGDIYSQWHLANYLKLAPNLNCRVFLFQDYEKISSILFYLGNRLPIVSSVSQDLYFGSHTKEAAGWFISDQEFWNSAMRNPTCVILLKNKFKAWQQTFVKEVADKSKEKITSIPFCQRAATDKAMLISNVCGKGKG